MMTEMRAKRALEPEGKGVTWTCEETNPGAKTYHRIAGALRERRTIMTLQVNGNLIIENVRNHSAETVEKLRKLLAAGAPAQADPRRKNFFELENCNEVFYIHVDQATSRVYLLATWEKDARPAVASAPATTPTVEFAAKSGSNRAA